MSMVVPQADLQRCISKVRLKDTRNSKLSTFPTIDALFSNTNTKMVHKGCKTTNAPAIGFFACTIISDSVEPWCCRLAPHVAGDSTH